MRKLFFAVALALVSLASTAQTSMKINMDLSVKPGDDFWQYAVGGWLKANPLDAQHPENGAFTDLYELNNDRINKLIMAYAEKKDLPQGSDGQKIGALYRLYMMVLIHYPLYGNPSSSLLREKKTYLLPLTSSETVNLARPLALRLARTLRPFLDAILSRNPCLLSLLRLCGWNVCFISL